MKTTVLIVAVLAVLGVGIWFFAGDRAPGSQPASLNETIQPAPEPDAPPLVTEPAPPTPTPTPAPTPPPALITPPPATPSVKEFNVEGGMFYFSPATMTVKKGDTVRVTFKNVNGMHDWKLDEFKAGTKVLQAGQQETIEFVADKAGSFEYYCSVGNHRAMGMKGMLTVTE